MKKKELDYSTDGCASQADINYRREMLNNIRDGFRNRTVITRERFWTYYGTIKE